MMITTIYHDTRFPINKLVATSFKPSQSWDAVVLHAILDQSSSSCTDHPSAGRGWFDSHCISAPLLQSFSSHPRIEFVTLLIAISVAYWVAKTSTAALQKSKYLKQSRDHARMDKVKKLL